MKIYKPSESLKQKRRESIDLGFDTKDKKMLDQESDYLPKVKIFAKSKLEHLYKLDDPQYCSSCRTELLLLEKTQKLLCKSCGNTISVMANTPLLETEQELRPFGTQVDGEYNDRPFAVGLIDSDPSEPDYEILDSSADGRIQSIKLKKGIPPNQYRIKPESIRSDT
jgi:hypothetical protein